MLRCIICLIFLLFLQVSAFVQEPAYWQLSEEEGLPSLTIYGIVQDKTGFMWLATANGLCRFDGKNIKSYRSSEVADNEIVILDMDRWERIWGSNLNGQLVTVRNDSLKVVSLPPPFDQVKASYFFISNEYLWVLNASFFGGSFFTLACFELDEENPPKLVETFTESEVVRCYSSTLKIDKKHYFWYLKDGEIKILEIFSNQIKTFLDFPNPSSLSINSNHRFLPVGEDKVLIFDKKDLRLFDTNSGQTIDFQENNVGLQKVLGLPDSTFWVCTTRGIWGIKNINKGFSDTAIFFENISVNTVFNDRENNLWLGTSSAGVIIVPNLSIKVYNTVNSGLAEDEVFTISAGAEVLMGHKKGHVSVLKGGQIKHKYHLKEETRVVSIAQTNDGLTWLGTDNGLIVPGHQVIDIGKDGLTGAIKEVIPGEGPAIWIASSANVSKAYYEGRQDGVIQLSKVERILPQRSYALYKDYNNAHWFGSVSGLFKYSNGHLDTFKEGSVFHAYRVSDIKQTADSSLWVATYGEGLLQIKNDTLVRKWNENTGFRTSTCTVIHAEENDLWVGTNKGMTLMREGSFTDYWIDNYDGLPSNEVRAIYKDSEGVWVGTPKGLANFPQSVLQKNEEPPGISITNLQVNDQDTSLQKNFRLQHNQNNLSVAFLGFAYRARGNVTYRYRLLGLTDQWMKTEQREVTFFTLAPGEYQFEVVAINEDGFQSVEPASFSFTILKPWWRKWWFQAGALFLLLGLSSGVVYWRQRDLRQQERVAQAFQDRINNLRLEALQTQMNPHFIFNALNAIQDFLITNDREQAIHYLSSFARMIRQIFDYSRRKTISLEEETEFLKLYLELEKLRFGDRVEINFDIDPNLKENITEYFLPPLLVQPIIENAFKHGLMHKKEKGTLSVFFEIVNEWVKCTVEDNGVGRQKAKEFSQWREKKRNTSGLIATKERLEIFHQNKELQPDNVLSITDLYDQEGKPAGTKVEIYI